MLVSGRPKDLANNGLVLVPTWVPILYRNSGDQTCHSKTNSWFAQIAARNLPLPPMSKNFTSKRALKTNQSVAKTAELQKKQLLGPTASHFRLPAQSAAPTPRFLLSPEATSRFCVLIALEKQNLHKLKLGF